MAGYFQDCRPASIGVTVGTGAIFPHAARGAGMYESFYLRAVAPGDPLGAWIRHTVHKPPGGAPRGSVWCTVFDAARGAPFMHKLTSAELSVPPQGWIAVGEAAADGEVVSGEGAALSPGEAVGRCGPARWRLRWSSREAELRHLGVELKDYRTGLLDFPCWMDDREVYLCWRLDEAEVGWWHEIEAGFSGRQALPDKGGDGQKAETSRMGSDS